MKYSLAQINIALARGPLDSDIMRDFTTALDEINALAEASPGFLWRMKEESGNSTGIKAFPDPRLIVNMSVWDDVATLKNYVYRSMHGRFFARRTEWFEKTESPHLALWWIPRDTIPTLEEAKERLEIIKREGPTPRAFDFKTVFEAP